MEKITLYVTDIKASVPMGQGLFNLMRQYPLYFASKTKLLYNPFANNKSGKAFPVLTN
jgi:hypothetical protein